MLGSVLEETLANYGALAIVRPDLVDMLRKDKPELVEALDEVIQEMLKESGWLSGSRKKADEDSSTSY